MLEKLIRRTGPRRGVRMRTRRHLPVAGLTLYYGAVIVLGLLIIEFVPGGRQAIAAPIEVSGMTDPFSTTATTPSPAPWGGPFGRLALTLFTVFGGEQHSNSAFCQLLIQFWSIMIFGLITFFFFSRL
jgi:hypothetical protein